MKYLLLWLEAPLQSWGYESRFDLRATHSFPTLSGVYGILLASSGDSGAQCELLDRMRNADFSAVEFVVPGAPPSSQLCDYHMVGGAYRETTLWESYNRLWKENSGSSNAKQTYRYYLQNRKFAVILGLPDDLAEKFSASLKSPVYDLYLGRKCCVPTDFIFRGLFALKDEAAAEMLRIAEEKGLSPERCFVPAALADLQDDAFFITDVPLEFGEHKRYTDRCVKIVEYETWENR